MGPATRREFLKTFSACSLGGSAGFAANLAGFNAFAADTSDYKALVCVFLFGGVDCHDFVIPYDVSSYNAWADIRQSMLGGFSGTRNRGALLPLAGVNQAGLEFALTEENRPLHELFAAGNAAVVGNVGPLVEPLNREQYRARSRRRPPRLFSHNDQQSVWMASEPEGAQYGWGGRLADIMLEARANPRTTFTAVSVSGNAVFLSGENARQFRVGTGGAIEPAPSRNRNFLGSNMIPGIMERHYRDEGGTLNNLFARDMADVAGFSIQANADLSFALDQSPPADVNFPAGNRLAGQLQVVANMIAQRDLLDVNRQIFFVSTGGFDTHSGQAGRLPQLQTGVASAMRAFYDATVSLGVADKVTSFTASDFGRTLRVNGDGTDHGWGGHHIVVGDAVNAGLFGEMPPAAFDHNQDTGRGRLIPTTSVDQYAAALGSWFGLSASELAEALPGLGNFDAGKLSGMFAA